MPDPVPARRHDPASNTRRGTGHTPLVTGMRLPAMQNLPPTDRQPARANLPSLRREGALSIPKSHVRLTVGETAPGDWRISAACRNYPPELFFAGKGGSYTEAKLICAACPVQAACLAEALARPTAGADELDGFWAGTTKFDRRRMRQASA